MTSALPITLLPSHPAEGWTSMNRYWEALARCVDQQNPGGAFHFSCPLEFQGLCTPRAGKLRLGFAKKIAYPRKVRRTVRSGIAHVLDHSYAFLLAAVPEGVRTIVTVHDLLPLREPEGLTPQAIARFRDRVEWVKKADLVIADSMATRNDLIELIQLDPAKIIVLPLGAEAFDDGKVAEPLPKEVVGDFIFSIGGYMKRKNLEIMPRVLEMVRKERPQLQLVRAGGLLPENLVAEFHQRCGGDALVQLGQVSDGVLSTLYRSAAVTVVPSRYEGFGLPVLEAMARGCPVVSARTTSLPEVGGDVPLYFEVDDAEEAAGKILEVLAADAVRLDDLKKRGLARAGRFTWDVHFQELLKIYAKLSEGSPTS